MLQLDGSSSLDIQRVPDQVVWLAGRKHLVPLRGLDSIEQVLANNRGGNCQKGSRDVRVMHIGKWGYRIDRKIKECGVSEDIRYYIKSD